MSFVIGILQNKTLSKTPRYLSSSDLGKFYSEHGMHFSLLLFIQSLYIYEYESK